MEQKYFISYAAYATGRMDILNDFVTTDEPISRELIEDIQETSVERLNEIKHENGEDLENKYYAVQIFNFIKLD